jgi:coiled-coil and C2 domain-containing protein 2A
MPFVPIGYEFVRSPLMEQQQERPLLTVLISLHPSVSWNPTCRALPINCSLKSKEDQSLVDHIKNWMTGLIKDYSNLNWIQLVNPLVVDQDGESVYLGRFLSPMKPPNDLIVDTDDDETLRNVCQFVAAIANSIQPDDPMLPHIWQSCQTTLEWLTGGDQERAVLLFNYMIEFKFDVYLLLGMAVPQGQTAQILYRDKKDTSILWLINPSTGARTNAKDSTGHVQQVWALVNQSQVGSNY